MSYIAFTVLQKNERFFFEDLGLSTQSIGASVLAPKASAHNVEIMGEFWAAPLYEGGVVRGFYYVPVAVSATAPVYGAFKVTRVKDMENGDTYHIMVTQANYIADTTTAITTVQLVPPAVQPCINASDEYVYLFEMPYSAANFKAYVTIDGVAQDAPAAVASLAALVTWLNTNIPEAGTWSASGTRLKLVNTDGKEIGVAIVASA